MSKHTPGPWKLVPLNFCWQVLSPRGQRIIAVCAGTTGLRADREAEANARLIAAAPDLLEAVRSLLSVVGTDSCQCARCVHARAAFAAATGGDE